MRETIAMSRNGFKVGDYVVCTHEIQCQGRTYPRGTVLRVIALPCWLDSDVMLCDRYGESASGTSSSNLKYARNKIGIPTILRKEVKSEYYSKNVRRRSW